LFAGTNLFQLENFHHHPNTRELTPSTMADDSANLKTFIESLPQELYDEIKRHVFAVPSGRVVWIEERHCTPFPVAMHISRSTRAEAEKVYFGQNTFVVLAAAYYHQWMDVFRIDIRHIHVISMRSWEPICDCPDSLCDSQTQTITYITPPTPITPSAVGLPSLPEPSA
jgi:hypothetical protein